MEARFRYLLEQAVRQTGKNAVVPVDEYDKPLLEVMSDEVLEEHNKAVFKGFFSPRSVGNGKKHDNRVRKVTFVQKY